LTGEKVAESVREVKKVEGTFYVHIPESSLNCAVISSKVKEEMKHDPCKSTVLRLGQNIEEGINKKRSTSISQE